MTWTPPDRVGEFAIVRRIGAGAMGEVFLAHDTLLDRRVAIKFVGQAEVGDAARERFLTEARAVARLSHPNVVAIHRVGELARRPYLVAEFVEGTPLDRVPKPLPWQRVVAIGVGLARGLAAAHRREVLHRDLKPANIILAGDDEPKLLDFGLATLADAALATGDAAAPAIAAPARPRAVAVDVDVDATAPARDRVAPAPREASVTHARSGDATRSLAIVGTPLYLAPELWRGESASRRSDLYALGAVLYELLVGGAPHAGHDVETLATLVVAAPAAPVATRAPGTPTALAQLVDRCLDRDPARRPVSADELAFELAALSSSHVAAPAEPYRGLAAFQAEHRAVFLGRDREIRDIGERLRGDRGLVLVGGDSGAGKSSLCRAGVLPALAAEGWQIATLTPGRDPLAALAAAIAPLADTAPAIVFVDQLEEAIALADATEADAFARALVALVAGAAGATAERRVLATARSDFLGRIAALAGFDEIATSALVLLGPLSARGLREAIVGPARLAGYTLEPALVEALVASGRASLPLLSFALVELWEARDEARRELTVASLATIGGVEGALARHADRVMASLAEGDRDHAWRVLLQLTSSEGTRAAVSRVELAAVLGDPRATERVIERLIAARLVAPAASLADGVEVTHEALFTHWPRLRDWRHAHDHDARFRDQLGEAARRWRDRGRPRGLLWRGDALAEYRAWRARWREPLAAGDAAFAAAALADARRAARVRAALIAATLLGAIAVAAVLYRANGRAERERATADAGRRTLLADQAANELAAGHDRRALAYFLELLRAGVETPGVRFGIAEATRNDARLHAVIDVPAGPVDARWLADGAHFAAVDRGNRMIIATADGAIEKALAIDFVADVIGFEATGRYVAATDTRYRFHVWDTRANALVPVPPAIDDGAGRPYSVAWDPAAPRVAVGRDNGTVDVWNVETGETHVFGTPGDAGVIVVAFAHAPDRVLASVASGRLLAWNLAGAAPAEPTAGATAIDLQRPAGITRVAVAPGGQIAVTSGPLVATWPTGDLGAPPLRTWLARADHAQTLSMTGAAITVGVRGGFEVFDAATLAPRASGSVDATATVLSVDVAPDGRHVATASEDLMFRVWDAEKPRLLAAFEASPHAGTGASVPAIAHFARYSPDGRYLLTVSGSDIRIWSVDDLPTLARLPHPRPARGAWSGRWAADGAHLAISGEGFAALVDARTGAPTALAAGELRTSFDVGFSPRGDRVLVTGQGGYAKLMALDGHAERTLSGLRGEVVGAIDATGTEIATADDAALRVHDRATGAIARELGASVKSLRGVKWTTYAGRRALLVCGYAGILAWRDALTGAELHAIHAANTQFLDFAIDPRGGRVATANHDGTVSIWDLATDAQRTLVGHTGPVTVIAYSPDGGLLATGAEQGGARIWDPDGGRELARRDYYDGLLGLDWSPDGTRLLLVGAELYIVDVHRDARTRAELEAALATNPWRLVGDRLVRATE